MAEDRRDEQREVGERRRGGGTTPARKHSFEELASGMIGSQVFET